LKVVNLFPNEGNWQFTFTANSSNNTDLEICTDIENVSNKNIEQLISGAIPELLNTNHLEINFNDKKITLFEMKDSLKSSLKSTEIKFKQEKTNNNLFSLKIIDCEISNFSKLLNKKILFNNIIDLTWFGSNIFDLNDCSLTWKILTSPEIIYSKEKREIKENEPLNIFFNIRGIDVSIYSDENLNKKIFKHSVFGLINDTSFEFFNSFKSILKNLGLNHYIIEFNNNSFFQQSILTGVVIDKEINQYSNMVSKNLSKSNKLSEFIEQLNEIKRKKEAEDLNIRMSLVDDNPKIYINNKFYGNVPKVELSLMMLFAKLEKSSLLPFNHFESYEFSPVGIDSIASFQINPDDVIQKFPVEFEFVYKNFLIHGHPKHHVKLVICWDLGGDLENLKIKQADKEWLYKPNDNNEYLIVVVSKFPFINIR